MDVGGWCVILLVMIKSFTDLEAWKEAHKLGLLVYELTAEFPPSEQFGLTSQMRRAAVSVTSNIAEGFGRKSVKDREHFFTMASGSLYELKSQTLFAKDLKYAQEFGYSILFTQLNTAHKLVHGLLRAHRK